MKEVNLATQGTVVAIRGSIVDVCFPQNLPKLHGLLKAGDRGKVALEVSTYLNTEVVRSHFQ